MRFSWKITGRVLLIAVSVAAVAYSSVMMIRYPGWVVDDAFILFRYAENLVDHGELNWNVGENPVEGYTGIAMVSLIALGMKLSISPIIAAHIIGIACYFIGAILLILIFRGFNLGSVSALVLYCTAPFLFTHAWSGLETTMFNTAILLAIYAFSVRNNAFFVGALLILGFTRPEGAVISIILIVFYRPVSRKTIIAWLVPCLIYFIWRWIYYGQFLPNTFYAKLSQAGISMENLIILRRLLVTYLPLPGLLALIFIGRDHFRKHRRLVFGTTVFTLIIILTYLCSRLMMNYSYRFFLPFYIVALVAVGGILCQVRPTVKAIVLTVLLVSMQAASNVERRKMKKEIEYSSTHFKVLRDIHIPAGKFLRDCVPTGEWLVVHADAGAIPYYSKLKTIDFGRLNDEYLARNIPRLTGIQNYRDLSKETRALITTLQSYEKGPSDDEKTLLAEYFFSRNPGAIAFTSYNFMRLDHGNESRIIAKDKRFDSYALVKKYKSKERRRYFEFIYLRDDIRIAANIPLLEEINSEGKETPPEHIDSGVEKEKINGKIRAASNSPDALWALSCGDIGIVAKLKCYEIIAMTYPNHEKAPEALWRIALHTILPMKRIEYYRRIIDNYPESERASEASFIIGFVYLEDLSDTLTAIEAFDIALKNYPESEIVETAETVIRRLKAGREAQP